MSRPRYYWHSIVRRMIGRYAELKDWQCAQELIYLGAINTAMELTSELPDGDTRMKAINMVLIKKTHTCEGAGLELHYSWRTIQNWCNDFVKLVGKEAGY